MNKFKVIKKSNFDSETVSDVLIEHYLNKEFAEKLCSMLNKELSSDSSTYFYRVVPESYELYEFMP